MAGIVNDVSQEECFGDGRVKLENYVVISQGIGSIIHVQYIAKRTGKNCVELYANEVHEG